MEASRTPETRQGGVPFDAGSDAASLERRARLCSIDDDVVESSRSGSRSDEGRADAPALSLIEHEQVRAHPSWSLVAHGHEFPDAQRLVSGDGRFAVVEERPFLHLVAPESRPEAEADQPRVLVVDDDAGTRALCSVILKLSALAVIEAPDGRAGLVQARLQRPDLIVTDVMMPGLDGFQLAEALGADERTRAIPVIFMSGLSESRSHALELGAAAYVTKPFNPVSFAAIVARVLANGRSAKGARDSDTAQEEA